MLMTAYAVAQCTNMSHKSHAIPVLCCTARRTKKHQAKEKGSHTARSQPVVACSRNTARWRSELRDEDTV